MTVAVQNPPAVGARIVVWVEDKLTYLYLQEAWADADIALSIAGGNESIRAVVHNERQAGRLNHFGVRDRDFAPTNYPNWSNPSSGTEVFTLPVHEVENYLLDENALAGNRLNTGRRTAAEVLTRMQAHAGTLAWWMACRRVLSEIRDSVFDTFPKHPGGPRDGTAMSRQLAEDYILNHPWYLGIGGTVAAWTPAEIRHRLTLAHAAMHGDIASGRWRETFSGKEIFKHVRGWVYGGRGGSSADHDSDLAMAVAQWQVANQAVPPTVAELRSALRRRVGLPP